MEQTITVGEKSYTLKELKYKDATSFSDNKSEAAKQLVQLSTEMSDADYDELTMQAGIKLTKEITKFNGLDKQDFPNPVQTKE